MRKKLLCKFSCREDQNNLYYNYTGKVHPGDWPEFLIRAALLLTKYDRNQIITITKKLCDEKADADLEEQLQKIRPVEQELDGILEDNGIVPGSSMSIDELKEKVSFPNDEE